MTEKSVNRRPRNIEVDQVINRGGSSPSAADNKKERIFNLRVPDELVVKVDALEKQNGAGITQYLDT